MRAIVKQIITTRGQRYKLLTIDGEIVRHTPSWGTENGAKRWAVKNGYELTDPHRERAVIARNHSKEMPIILLLSGREYEFPHKIAAIKYARSRFPSVDIEDLTEV